MQWEGLLGISEVQVWGEYTNDIARKVAVIRGMADIARIGVDIGRATDSRHIHRTVREAYDPSFEWEQWVTYQNCGEVLKLALGTVTTSPSGGLYEHTATPINVATSLPNFNLFMDIGVGDSPTLQLCGCKISEILLENDTADCLRMTVRGTAKTHRRTSAMTLTDDDCVQFAIQPYRFNDLSVVKGVGGDHWNYFRTMENLVIRINNELDSEKWPIDGTVYRAEQHGGVANITGSFDMEHEAWTDFDAFADDSRVDLRFTWTHPTDGYTLTITLRNCKYQAYTLPEISGTSGRSIVTVDFIAQYNE